MGLGEVIVFLGRDMRCIFCALRESGRGTMFVGDVSVVSLVVAGFICGVYSRLGFGLAGSYK